LSRETNFYTEGATTDRKIVHEEEKPGVANKVPFKADARKPYAHPYYWAPFILIGNWKWEIVTLLLVSGKFA
jgi:CHAT domain-containing protein